MAGPFRSFVARPGPPAQITHTAGSSTREALPVSRRAQDPAGPWRRAIDPQVVHVLPSVAAALLAHRARHLVHPLSAPRRRLLPLHRRSPPPPSPRQAKGRPARQRASARGKALNDDDQRRLSTAAKLVFGREELQSMATTRCRTCSCACRACRCKAAASHARPGQSYTQILLNGEPAPPASRWTR